MNSGEFTHWLRAPVQHVNPVSCPKNWEACTGTDTPCGCSHWSAAFTAADRTRLRCLWWRLRSSSLHTGM